MIEKNVSENQKPSWRMFGYMITMIVLGISIGLLLYPSLRYPAIWQYCLLGLSLIMMIFTAPALHRKG